MPASQQNINYVTRMLAEANAVVVRVGLDSQAHPSRENVLLLIPGKHIDSKAISILIRRYTSEGLSMLIEKQEILHVNSLLNIDSNFSATGQTILPKRLDDLIATFPDVEVLNQGVAMSVKEAMEQLFRRGLTEQQIEMTRRRPAGKIGGPP